MSRQVTERDFRMPEFRDAKVEDYEIRADGKVVRKDRWETGIHQIKGIVGSSRGEFEIADVVDAVRKLRGNWEDAEPDDRSTPFLRDGPGSMRTRPRTTAFHLPLAIRRYRLHPRRLRR